MLSVTVAAALLLTLDNVIRNQNTMVVQFFKAAWSMALSSVLLVGSLHTPARFLGCCRRLEKGR